MSERLLDRLVARGVVTALRAAADHRVLEALDPPATGPEIAARLGLAPRGTALLLDVLASIGLAEEREGRYGLVPLSGLAEEAWGRIDALLVRGEVGPGIDEPGDRGAFYADRVGALGEVFAAPAEELAASLPEVGSVLDLGAGSGVWSLAMARRSARTTVLALERPEVVPAFERAARAAELDGRARALAGDYFAAAFEDRFDRIVLANVLHLESPAAAAALVRRHAEHLSEGGELVIVDFFGERAHHDARVTRAVYALHLGLRSAAGRAHPLEDLRTWCAAAGLARQRLVPLSTTRGAVSALVAGRLPEGAP